MCGNSDKAAQEFQKLHFLSFPFLIYANQMMIPACAFLTFIAFSRAWGRTRGGAAEEVRFCNRGDVLFTDHW